tara:strand:- start:53 stop:295 length:243 start_codon:yes stop_codon:yes gene_type:complete
MTKNKSIQLLKLVKIKLMSLALQDRRIKDDAMTMIEKTNSMIREIRTRNTKLDVELLEEITNILGIGIEEEYSRLIRRFR